MRPAAHSTASARLSMVAARSRRPGGRASGLVGLASIVVLAACATREAPAPSPAPTTPGRTTPARPAPPPATPAPPATAAPSKARTVDEYKREVALRIQQLSAAWVHDERPQALLRAVIVARVKVDAAGMPQVEILRSPDAALTPRVLQSVRAAAPFPQPPRALVAQLANGYTESWLFNDDGRFQIRTVARPQMNE